MLTLGELEKCRRYIESHSSAKENYKNRIPPGPCITLSRETGTCAACIGKELIKFFEEKMDEEKGYWTIFDKNLIEKVLEDNHLPRTLKKLMEEDKVSFFASMLNEMFSGLPGQWSLIKKQSETILQIASLGNVIIIGRGANLVTQSMPNAFHIRLISPLNDRVRNFAQAHKLDYKKAHTIVEQHDSCRMKYIHTVFNKKIDDPSLYNMVFNTKGLTYSQVARFIGSVIVEKFSGYFEKAKERDFQPVSYLI